MGWGGEGGENGVWGLLCMCDKNKQMCVLLSTCFHID